MLPPRGGGGRGYSSLSMKPIRLFLFALSVLASSTALFAAIVQFGSTSQTAWTATAADGCDMGSTVTLHGVKVTLGSPADVGNNWTWHAGNTGLLPSQMPSTDGTAETLITTFAEAAPFGTLPTRGCFLKIEPSLAGTVTISGKPSANVAQQLVFATVSKDAPETILAAKVTPYNASATSWSYDVDANHIYYFFQLSYPGKLNGYRFTLRALAFEQPSAPLPAVYYELLAEIEQARQLMGPSHEAVIAAQAALDDENGTAESYAAALAALKAAEQAHISYLQSLPLGEGFPIVGGPIVADIVTDDTNDHPVVGVAAKALAADIRLVTGQEPEVKPTAAAQRYPIIIGTLGQSDIVDQLANTGKVDCSAIEGKWEAYTLQYVENIGDSIPRALVIAGSTPRGTAYGVFHLSRLIGVSPWVWWADVVPAHHDQLYFTAADNFTSKEPSVRFRGIFINDEDWGLQPWASAKMDTNIHNIGPRTYERVFELLLRLRANILWPAMHKVSRAFWTIDENPQLAAQYDIVLGSSHCEPMLRNNVGEWAASGASYNYATNRTAVQQYWRTRVEESKDQDVMYTLGMRGVHDGGIQGYSGATNIAAGLQEIIAFQRSLIRSIVNEDLTQVPQTFIPYKEVLDAYNTGMNVPDDVTLTWVDDNHGFIRQMPTETEQQRAGSHGIYYHLSYYGAPQDYLWLSSIGPAQISYELTRGYEQGIQRLWIINVGDIKPAEAELQFCMDLAWDVDAWNPENANQWNRHWAAENFGEEVADGLAEVKKEYYRLAAGGKPEHVMFVDYSNEEMEARLAAYNTIAKQVEALKPSIRPELSDAYFQLIEYPVMGAYLMNVKHLRALQSMSEARLGHAAQALQYADEAREAYNEIQRLTTIYNKNIAHGKWDGIMSASPRSQPAFQMPTVATQTNISPVESMSSADSQMTIAASAYVTASSTLRKLQGLGMQQEAVAVWPMDMKSYTQAADAPYAEYVLPVKAGENVVTLRLLPTFPVHAGGTLRYATELLGHDANPVINSIATSANAADWKQNVLRGWATGKSIAYTAAEAGEVKLRIYFMDPGLALQEITIDQPNGNSLTNQYVVNADFELAAEGVVNTGSGTVRGVPYGWQTNQEFPGNSKGINGTGANMHGSNSCWFWNKPMPTDFEFFQTIKNLPAGSYRLTCRLGAKKDYIGTLRLFADNNVAYFGAQADYKASVFKDNENNSFAGHVGTSDYNTLQNMTVDFTTTTDGDVSIGIRTSNQRPDGSYDTSGETGTFRVDYFQLYALGTTNILSVSTSQNHSHNGAVYDLSGRITAADTPGQIIIRNGRKLINKLR